MKDFTWFLEVPDHGKAQTRALRLGRLEIQVVRFIRTAAIPTAAGKAQLTARLATVLLQLNIFTIKHVSPHGRVPVAVCCSMDVMPLESGGGGMHGGCGIIPVSLLVFHRRA